MNKNILLSLCIVGAVGVIATGATISYFSDTETSSGNTFTAGTLNLKVGDDDPTTWSFNVAGIKPGDNGSEEAVLQNTGSINGYLHITFENLVNDEMECVEPELNDTNPPDDTCGNPGADMGELAENLDLLIYIDEIGGVGGKFDLVIDTLVYQGKLKGILQGDEFNYFLASNAQRDFRVKWWLDSSVGNIVQSDKAGFDIVFELTQTQKDIAGDWHFNEDGDLTAYDSSGRGNRGTLMNGADWGDGKYNPAMSFDGVNDYVNCGNDPSLDITDAITIEAWVKLEGTGGTIIGKWLPSNYYRSWFGGISSGQPIFQLSADGTAAGGTSKTYTDLTLQVGQWHHVVFTSDGTTMRAYLDGVASAQTATSPLSIHSTNHCVGIGDYIAYQCKPHPSASVNSFFNGFIDEVRIYNRALTTEEIEDHYNSGM